MLLAVKNFSLPRSSHDTGHGTERKKTDNGSRCGFWRRSLAVACRKFGSLKRAEQQLSCCGVRLSAGDSEAVTSPGRHVIALGESMRGLQCVLPASDQTRKGKEKTKVHTNHKRVVPVRASPVPRKKERKQKTQAPGQGWEDGTPPPHGDFKERSVLLAVTHPRSGVYLGALGVQSSTSHPGPGS